MALAIEAELSCPARAVIEIMEELKEDIGTPKYIRCDNGPEFVGLVQEKLYRTF